MFTVKEPVAKRNQAAVHCFYKRCGYEVILLVAQDACGFDCMMTSLQQKQQRVILALIPSTITGLLWEVGVVAPTPWERLLASSLLCKQ